MRFTTASGAVYDIFDVEGQSYITRDSKIPVIDVMTGGDMPEIVATKVHFDREPNVGERFRYLTESHGFCVSTPVTEVQA